MREEIETILTRWTDINEILLRTGEMTAQERRTVLAVTNAMAREVREALVEHENELNRWRSALGNADAERDRLRKIVKEKDNDR